MKQSLPSNNRYTYSHDVHDAQASSQRVTKFFFFFSTIFLPDVRSSKREGRILRFIRLGNTERMGIVGCIRSQEQHTTFFFFFLISSFFDTYNTFFFPLFFLFCYFFWCCTNYRSRTFNVELKLERSSQINIFFFLFILSFVIYTYTT